jgi:hypothetical protein
MWDPRRLYGNGFTFLRVHNTICHLLSVCRVTVVPLPRGKPPFAAQVNDNARNVTVLSQRDLLYLPCDDCWTRVLGSSASRCGWMEPSHSGGAVFIASRGQMCLGRGGGFRRP